MGLTAHPSSTADLDRLLRSLGTVRQQVRTERLVERLRISPVDIDAVRHRWLRRTTELDLRGGPTLAVWLYHPLPSRPLRSRPVDLRAIGWHDSIGWLLGITTGAGSTATLLAWQLRIGPADRP